MQQLYLSFPESENWNQALMMFKVNHCNYLKAKVKSIEPTMATARIETWVGPLYSPWDIQIMTFLSRLMQAF